MIGLILAPARARGCALGAGGKVSCQPLLLALLLAATGCGESAPAHVEGSSSEPQPEATYQVPPVSIPPAQLPPVVPPPEVEPSVAPCECAASAALLPIGCSAEDNAQRGDPAISADGETIAFDSCQLDGSRCRVFRWTAETGTQVVPSTSLGASVAGLSPDGDVVLMSPNQEVFGTEALVYRFSDEMLFRTGLRPGPVVLSGNGSVVGLALGTGSPWLARWHADTGRELLGELPAASEFMLASGPDTTAIAGVRYQDGVSEPFRWTPEQGFVLGLGEVSELADFELGLSADGSTLAGYRRSDGATRRAFRWTEADGASELGFETSERTRIAVSSDGATLALAQDAPDLGYDCGPGTLCSATTLRWRAGEGVEELTPGALSTPQLISLDGNRIVGQAGAPPNQTLFDWTPERGAQNVQLALEATGVDATGWVLGDASALSDTGKVLVGRGMCGARTVVFRAELTD